MLIYFYFPVAHSPGATIILFFSPISPSLWTHMIRYSPFTLFSPKVVHQEWKREGEPKFL